MSEQVNIAVRCKVEDSRLLLMFDNKNSLDHCCVHGITLRWHRNDCEDYFEDADETLGSE